VSRVVGFIVEKIASKKLKFCSVRPM
jgi:hypothetical protein